ncbi:hypothetical protein CC79DRAFT_1337137 [Sarocladium strictum]
MSSSAVRKPRLFTFCQDGRRGKSCRSAKNFRPLGTASQRNSSCSTRLVSVHANANKTMSYRHTHKGRGQNGMPMVALDSDHLSPTWH